MENFDIPPDYLEDMADNRNEWRASVHRGAAHYDDRIAEVRENADAEDMRGGKPLTVQARAAKFGSARILEDSVSRASVFIFIEGCINGEEQLKIVTSSSIPMDCPKQNK